MISVNLLSRISELIFKGSNYIVLIMVITGVLITLLMIMLVLGKLLMMLIVNMKLVNTKKKFATAKN